MDDWSQVIDDITVVKVRTHNSYGVMQKVRHSTREGGGMAGKVTKCDKGGGGSAEKVTSLTLKIYFYDFTIYQFLK